MNDRQREKSGRAKRGAYECENRKREERRDERREDER